jgi:methionyl aminopeptidase
LERSLTSAICAKAAEFKRDLMNLLDQATIDRRKPGHIKIYGQDAFAAMHKAGRLAAEALDLMVDAVKPGVSTETLDKMVFEFGMDHGAFPATLQYRGYTKSCCTSVNHVVCHGIPDEKPLRDGDIVNIDITLIVDGWHGDSSRMYCVGEVPRRAERLVEVTYESLMLGIGAIKAGVYLGDIGAAIQAHAERERCSVVRDFCGHGVGKLFHDEPNVLHYGHRGEGPMLKPGMIFTVEPMINLGRPHVKILSDGWTAVTRDRSLSAQFEHTVGVTETGCEIFTLSPKGWDNPSAARTSSAENNG